MASSSAATTTSLSTLSFLAGATILLGLLLPAEGALAACLTPPYLFFTVNLIILAVWGLSTSPVLRAADEPPPVVAADVACSDDDDDDREELELPPPPKKDAEAEDALHSDASCLTSDAEEEPAPVPAPAATWRSVRSAAPDVEEVAEAVCTDEMDRRFEEFIRKVNEQMRMQRQD